MFAQISAFFDNVLLKCKCEFLKGYSTKHNNLKMLEERKKCVGKRKVFGALLTDLSKTFDCLDHKWLTAKLNVYSFNIPALRLKHDHFSNRKQKIKIENTYSTWMEVLFVVSHCSVLRPLLYNIFLADLFLIIGNIDIASYVDDNTPYIAADNTDALIKSLEEASTALFQLFDNNLLKNNLSECHLLISSNENITVKICEYEIENSELEKLLGVKLDWKLNIDDCISDICKKARGKLNALVKIPPFIGFSNSW